jgi:DnaK suppressor protein
MKRLREKLEAERARLEEIIGEYDKMRELSRLAETGSEHNADPNNADGGSLAFEMEMDLSVQQNSRELLAKVLHALDRMDQGTYGTCEVSGKPIPIARLEALPYATTLVEWANKI